LRVDDASEDSLLAVVGPGAIAAAAAAEKGVDRRRDFRQDPQLGLIALARLRRRAPVPRARRTV
jgi:hypothetical protein